MNKHIISLLLENESGALSRVAGLFSARAYNIESLSVAPTDDETLSRMTIVTSGTDEIVEQIRKQLNKLVDVIKLVDLTESEHIERELMLAKVEAIGDARDEVKRLVDIFNGRVVDVTDTTYTVEITDTRDRLNSFLTSLSSIKIHEVVRSGAIGISSGEKILAV
jgi:acetolactate synthase I/III small subunit